VLQGKQAEKIVVRIRAEEKKQQTETRQVNTDPHNQKEKGLILVLTPQGEIMWVHPDIIESQQWTTVASIKSKGKAKASSSNVVSLQEKLRKIIASLTSSGDEESAFVADTSTSPTSKTRSGIRRADSKLLIAN